MRRRWRLAISAIGGVVVSLFAAVILGNVPLASDSVVVSTKLPGGSGTYRLFEAAGRSRVGLVLGSGATLAGVQGSSGEDIALPAWLGELPVSSAPVSVWVFEASGWPARSLVAGPRSPSFEWSLMGRSLRVPRGVWWPGVALNTLVGIAVIMFVWEGTRKLRSWNRKRSGLC